MKSEFLLSHLFDLLSVLIVTLLLTFRFATVKEKTLNSSSAPCQNFKKELPISPLTDRSCTNTPSGNNGHLYYEMFHVKKPTILLRACIINDNPMTAKLERTGHSARPWVFT